MPVWDRACLEDFVRVRGLVGQPIVAANGCFDLLHPGHTAFLWKAKQVTHGAALIVLLNSDRSIAERKGAGRPIYSLEDRSEMVFAHYAVDAVGSFDTEDELAELLRAIRPDVLVKGEDWRGKPITGAEYCGRVEYVPLLPGVSTSAIVERIRATPADGRPRKP